MVNELKPCPFCGGTVLRSGGDDKVVGFSCLRCEAIGPNHYGEFEWNTRADTARLSELEAEVARLREVCQAQSTEHRIHIRQMQKNHSDELALFSSSLGALREAAQTAIGLLQEKKHGSPARSPGHNAQVVLRTALEAQS